MRSFISLTKLTTEASEIFKQDIEALFVIDTEQEVNKLIKKLHDLITKLLDCTHDKKTEHGSITKKSLNILQSKLDSNIDIQSLQRKILQLYLVLLEQEYQITSPPLGAFTEIRRDKPIITPANIVKASLAEQLYSQLETELTKPTLSLSSDQSLGRLCLWLFLKEGINIKDISILLTDAYSLNKTNKLSYFSGNQQYLLSPVAETLLVLHRHSFIDEKYYKRSTFLVKKAASLQYKYCTAEPRFSLQISSLKDSIQFTSTKIIKSINKYCHLTNTIPLNNDINLSDIRLCHRIETVLTQSSIDFRIQANLLQSTPLPHSAMKRVLLDKVDLQRKKHELTTYQGATVRQNTAWKKSTKSSYGIKELDSHELTQRLKSFLDLITKKNTKREEAHQKRQIRCDFSNWLETPENAGKYPVVWVLVSWMYQLLYKGGKKKGTLSFSTVIDYISTVSKPFITEFNYCDLFTMDALEWAEKLNTVAEEVNSTKRKSYVLYFADFIVSSQIVPDLCLSDLDIPTSKANVSANLITLTEADAITSFLDKDNTVSELALIVFLLGFYGGLRRGEIGGLQFNDFHKNEQGYLQVHIRLNKYRSLKTSNSARNLPLDSLMPTHWQKKLISFIDKSKQGSQKANTLAFQNNKQLRSAFTLVTIALKEITQDNELRFHHLRHSFANWNWLLINLNRYPIDNLPLPLQNDFFSIKRQERLFHRLGIQTYTRKKAFVLSRLLGHSAIETTFSSYVHLTSLHIYLLNMKRNESPLHFLQHNIDYTIKLDNESMRPTRKGKPLALYHDALPREVIGKRRPDLESSLQLIINKEEGGVRSDTLNMADILKCISLLSYGYSINQSAELSKVTESVISRIAFRLEDHNEIYTKRSKSTLPEFCGITKLNQYQKEQIKFFVQQFDKSIESGSLLNAKIDFQQVTNALHYCVGAKGHLIRTHSVKVVAFLLKMMKVVGIRDDHIRVKWHFTHEMAADDITIEKVISHYRYWEHLIQKRVGYKATIIEVVIPHQYDRLSQEFKKNGIEVNRSDEAKFLGYHDKGNISIYLLQTKKSNRDPTTKEFQKLISMSPQRSRAYITFLQLLDVYRHIALL